MLRVIGVAANYKLRPSQLLDIPDAYTAYCFDEACAVIKQRIKDGEEPVEKTTYTRPSELYKKFQ